MFKSLNKSQKSIFSHLRATTNSSQKSQLRITENLRCKCLRRTRDKSLALLLTTKNPNSLTISSTRLKELGTLCRHIRI